MNDHILRSTVVLAAAGACGVCFSFQHQGFGLALALLAWFQLGCLIEDVRG